MRVFLVVKSFVPSHLKKDFDDWYKNEHLSEAKQSFRAISASRGWEIENEDIHYAHYEFDNLKKANEILKSEELKKTILIYDKKLPMIAAIHVGWKGAFKNILKKCIKFMIKKGSENQNISAVIGPSIFRENYEVKRNFMKKFLNLNSRNRKFFYFKKSRIFFNLKEFIKSQLRSLKINNIDIINKDTFKNRTEFFSARRALKNKENDYGRNISIIMLK